MTVQTRWIFNDTFAGDEGMMRWWLNRGVDPTQVPASSVEWNRRKMHYRLFPKDRPRTVEALEASTKHTLTVTKPPFFMTSVEVDIP